MFRKIDYLRVDAELRQYRNFRLSNQEIYGIYTSAATNNYDGKPGAILSSIPNSLLRWEAARQINLKLNMGLFNRLTVLLEAYRKKTVDAIVGVPVSRATGETSAQSNTGVLSNEGIELTVKYDVIKNDKKGLYWSIEVNGSHNRNKALELYNENDKTNGNFIWKKDTM